MLFSNNVSFVFVCVTPISHNLHCISLIYIFLNELFAIKGNISFAQVLRNTKRLTMISRPFVEICYNKVPIMNLPCNGNSLIKSEHVQLMNMRFYKKHCRKRSRAMLRSLIANAGYCS